LTLKVFTLSLHVTGNDVITVFLRSVVRYSWQSKDETETRLYSEKFVC